MSLLDFNRDGKVSNFEKAVGMAMLASELERIDGYRKASPLREKRNRVQPPPKPSRLDGVVGVVGIIALLSVPLTFILGLGLAFSELDTSGMSYEEAMRAIDFRYIPVFISGIVSIVSMISLLILVKLAPLCEISTIGKDGEA